MTRPSPVPRELRTLGHPGPARGRRRRERSLMPVRLVAAVATVLLATTPLTARAQATSDAPGGRPAAIVDLATDEGVRLVKGRWRYHDARIEDLRPSGPPNRTHDITPHAGAADFDDSAWDVLAPSELEARKGNGRLSFNWYRIKVTIPDRIGAFGPPGSTVVFEVVVDDYAEVWVDGALPVALGQTGGPSIKGFNAPNRVTLGRDVRPGQQFQIAVGQAPAGRRRVPVHRRPGVGPPVGHRGRLFALQ